MSCHTDSHTDCHTVAMDIRVGPEPAERAAIWIAHRIRGAARRRGEASLALSGGGTAPSLIAALLAEDVPWSQTTVWQVDERIAPNGDPARNANQLAPLPCRVRPMPVMAGDRRRAARQYAASLPERFDVVHLGLGGDGHTASWPPGDVTPISTDRAVELIAEFNGYPRMTLTRRVVNGARSRAVLAAGASKRDVVERWFLGDRSLPITGVRRGSTWVFLDGAAAPAGLPASG
jgi:6-phosphogluconolactonase/glucosamine-6-phosphate isomerase/deaminase